MESHGGGIGIVWYSRCKDIVPHTSLCYNRTHRQHPQKYLGVIPWWFTSLFGQVRYTTYSKCLYILKQNIWVTNIVVRQPACISGFPPNFKYSTCSGTSMTYDSISGPLAFNIWAIWQCLGFRATRKQTIIIFINTKQWGMEYVVNAPNL